MFHHLVPLSFAVLLSAALPAWAQNNEVKGIKLYETTVSTTKLQVQPETNRQYFDPVEALKTSQGAIGNQLGDYTFLNHSGRKVSLSDYRGKPLIISMIYTHCPFICVTTTRNLTALKESREALGADSFGVLTIGFDTDNDTPEAMDNFAKRLDVKVPNWEFVSADAETINKLSKDLGFVFMPAPEGGFNHTTQTTFIDANGKVNLHIYGDEFENRTLLEPLKNMIYNVKTTDPIYNFETAESGFNGLAKSVRFFCTVYDSQTGKYTVDYSFFYGIGLGILVSLFITWWIVKEFRGSPRRNRGHHA
ncbi:MAG: SCO family protein [Gallionella sp.]|nr:SCO family protein [Gallionella sp.]